MSRSTLLSSIKSIFISTLSSRCEARHFSVSHNRQETARPGFTHLCRQTCFSNRPKSLCRLSALEEASTTSHLEVSNIANRYSVFAGELYDRWMAQSMRDAQESHGATRSASRVGRSNHFAVEAETCELQRYQALL